VELYAPVKVISLEIMLKVPHIGRCAGSLDCGAVILLTDREPLLSVVWLMFDEELEKKVEHRLQLNIRGIRTRHHHDGFSGTNDGGEEMMFILSILIFVQVPLAVKKR
jgi:hypothetical protein